MLRERRFPEHPYDGDPTQLRSPTGGRAGGAAPVIFFCYQVLLRPACAHRCCPGRRGDPLVSCCAFCILSRKYHRHLLESTHAHSVVPPSSLVSGHQFTRRVGRSTFQTLPLHPPVLLGVLRLRSCSPRPAKALHPHVAVQLGSSQEGMQEGRLGRGGWGPVIQQPDERAQGEEDGGRARSSFWSGPLQQPS